MTTTIPSPDDLLVIAPQNAATGFRLAGTRTAVASGPDEVRRLVEAEVDAGSRGVIAVAAVSWQALPGPVRRAWSSSTAPLIIPLPAEDPGSIATRSARVRDLLARSVGYEITFTPEGDPP